MRLVWAGISRDTAAASSTASTFTSTSTATSTSAAGPAGVHGHGHLDGVPNAGPAVPHHQWCRPAASAFAAAARLVQHMGAAIGAVARVVVGAPTALLPLVNPWCMAGAGKVLSSCAW